MYDVEVMTLKLIKKPGGLALKLNYRAVAQVQRGQRKVVSRKDTTMSAQETKVETTKERKSCLRNAQNSELSAATKRDSQGSSSTSSTKSSSVEFTSVRINYHSIRLGDNPSVSEGLPIAIGSRRGSSNFSVDDYEAKRGTPKPAVKLSKESRNALIQRNKHSRNSLVMTRKQIREIQKSRLQSKQDDLREDDENTRAQSDERKKTRFFLLRWKKERKSQ